MDVSLTRVNSENDVYIRKSVDFLQNLTTIFSNQHMDINVLIGLFSSSQISSDSKITLIAQADIKQQLLTMESFRRSAKYSVTHLTHTVLGYIQMNNVFEGKSQMRHTHYRNVLKLATALKKYLVQVHPHLKINYVEECVCNFVVSLMQLLQNTDAYPIQNIYVLSTLTDILSQLKEVTFTKDVILKGILTNLQACEMNLLSFTPTALFEMAFYEKLMCNLSVLKELLLYSIEQHDHYGSRDYTLNRNVCSQINTVLNGIRGVAPAYLKRSVQECLNLMND